MEAIAKGRFYSTTGGTARLYDLQVEDWGLDVQNIVYAIYLTSKSSAAAQVSIEHHHGAVADVNAMVPLAPAPIVLVAIVSGMPTTLNGQTSGTTLPYFRPRVVADSTGATEEWWEGEVWAGGRPF